MVGSNGFNAVRSADGSIRSRISQNNTPGPRLGHNKRNLKLGNGRNSKERHYRSKEHQFQRNTEEKSDISQELIQQQRMLAGGPSRMSGMNVEQEV